MAGGVDGPPTGVQIARGAHHRDHHDDDPRGQQRAGNDGDHDQPATAIAPGGHRCPHGTRTAGGPRGRAPTIGPWPDESPVTTSPTWPAWPGSTSPMMSWTASPASWG